MGFEAQAIQNLKEASRETRFAVENLHPVTFETQRELALLALDILDHAIGWLMSVPSVPARTKAPT
jgi:hypothetical protein